MSVMQRSGSRPIGIIIAVVVISLCVYGAIQLASNNDGVQPGSNEPIATNQPASPLAPAQDNQTNKPATNTPARPGGTSNQPSDQPSDGSQAPNRRTETDQDPDVVATGSESSDNERDARGSLPSTGPGSEILALSLVIVLTSAYFSSRRRLTNLTLSR